MFPLLLMVMVKLEEKKLKYEDTAVCLLKTLQHKIIKY